MERVTSLLRATRAKFAQVPLMTSLRAAALLIGGAVILSGCADLAPVIQAMAADQNQVCVRITSGWAALSTEISRNHGCDPVAVGQVGK